MSALARKILTLAESPPLRLTYGVAASATTVYVNGSTGAVTVSTLDGVSMTANDYVAIMQSGADLLVVGVVGDGWQTYTPTLTGWAIGNGTITSRYRVSGGTCFVLDHVEFGSTSTFTGSATLSLPVATSIPAATLYLEGVAYISSLTSGLYPIKWRSASTTTTIAMYSAASGSFAQLGGVVQGSPGTFSSTSGLLRQGFYEIT